ncbi:Lecithin:cholesterol/phospholipid:diacylglycerol acyltransferase [Purpureocillium lavendulum]|uniref:Lecithin:cholesterol/phospholipid:diacylglycerol acyltransferase n=1 Tax=Purpureocillium lavendulum TaxID=1247861 RepID=A0AB34FQK9_9HYPO|nr:Lecithin:cholesterol/phospholipid:diacylglycerol acyltransferase [Purpureocillium lavendulum]
MGQSIIDRIQAKLELFRLEQRYTRRRHRRSTFVSNAIYVDGEYIYQTPNSTGSSTDSSGTRIDALHGERAMAVSAAKHTAQMSSANANTTTTTTITTEIPSATAERKRLNRFSSIPSFGGAFGGSGKDRSKVVERRTSMIR